MRFRVVIFLIVLTGCLDDFPIETTESDPQIIIEGLIVNEPGGSFVRISFTESVSGNTQTTSGLESDAEVNVVNSSGDTIIFCEKGVGRYLSVDSQFTGNIGESYQLFIRLDNGETFESEVETLNNSLSIDSLFVEFETITLPGTDQLGGRHNFFVAARSGNEEAPFFFRTQSNGIAQVGAQIVPPLDDCGPPCFQACWSFREPINNSVFLGSSELIQGESITLEVATEDYDFASFYFIEVSLFSLSESGFEFWSSVNNQLSIDGSIFDPQVSDISAGNIKNSENDEPVIGYFGASAVSKSSLLFNRFESTEELMLRPPIPVSNNGPCTRVWENATLVCPEQFKP